jgi:hypothetical protein
MIGESLVSLTKVELVGENWFQLAGPALLALAAIVAALVAAYVAIQSRKTQLEHDQLMRDREHARVIVYGALETMVKARELIADCRMSVAAAEVARKHAELTEERDPEEMKVKARRAESESAADAERADKAIQRLIPEMQATTVRLGVAFGVRSAVNTCHYEATEALCALYEGVTNGTVTNRIQSEKEEEAAMLGHFHESREGFENACRDRFGWSDPTDYVQHKKFIWRWRPSRQGRS